MKKIILTFLSINFFCLMATAEEGMWLPSLIGQTKLSDFYSDANSTLRIAYGKVAGFTPRDGISYAHQTTLDGVMEKDNPEIYDYDVPEKLRQLYRAKDYGVWNVDGTVPVAFIASNHTTGGNSGSPVINGNGELIGVNFDRCWESTMSDIVYDKDMCRNIAVDMRYVLYHNREIVRCRLFVKRDANCKIKFIYLQETVNI